MAWPDVGCCALALLYLRIELADRYAQLGARFEHLGARADESEVLIVGDLDQPVENRVVEHFPPVPILLISRIDRRVVGFEPFLGNRRRRRSKVWADQTPGAAKRQKDSQSSKPQNRPIRLPPSGAAHKHSPPGGPKRLSPCFGFGSFSLRRVQVQAWIVAVQDQAPGPSSTISIRRFCARPCGVSFGATGCAEPLGRQDVRVDPPRLEKRDNGCGPVR